MATHPIIPPSSLDQTAVSTPTVTAEPEGIETPVSAQDPSAVSFPLPTKSSATPGPGPRDAARISFASTRYSTTSSIFSVRPISTASTALTRGSSVRQSSLDSEPFSAISPWENERRKDSFDASHRYFCTFCDSAFEFKAAWKEHQLSSHATSYPCYPCGICFEGASSLSNHLLNEHGAESATQQSLDPRSLSPAQRWGCGFCATPLFSHADYLDHVSDHIDEGKERVHWQRHSVIKALLQTPTLREAWERVVEQQEAARGSKLRFFWDEHACFLLQRPLECFSSDYENAEQLAEKVLRAAEVKVIENITGQYITDGLSSHIPSNPAAQSVRVKQPDTSIPDIPEQPEDSGPILSSTPRVAPSAFPIPSIVGPSARPFGPFLSHVAVRPEGLASPAPRVIAKITESQLAQHSAAIGPDPACLQPVPFLRDSPRQGTLRRVESDWDLSLVRLGQTRVSEPGIHRPRTASARIDNVVPATPEDDHRHPSSSFQTPEDRSPVSHAPSEEWLISHTDYPRGPPSGSSLLSLRTMENSHSIDTSDCETISEPESWLDLSDDPESARWVREYYQRVGNVMGHLWVCYNRDWDALITRCVGEQSGSNYPQPGQGSGRDTRGQASLTGPQFSSFPLQPHLRPGGDRDDDDDMEDLRPTSSQSKRGSATKKRFACPFRKHAPNVFSVTEHEICALRSWDSVSRMKEHLYRKHCKIHCPRCKQTFRKQTDLEAHEMLPKGCQVRKVKTPADITAQQEKQLKSKRHIAQRQSEEDKWRDIYRLLFPGEKVPSPYPEVAQDLPASPESRNNLNFQHFLLQQMPLIFRQTAATHYGRPFADHDMLTIEGINRIITDSINRAFEDWQATDGSVPSNVTPSSIFHDSMATSVSPSLPQTTPEPAPRFPCNEPRMFQDFQPSPPELNNYSAWQGLDTIANPFPMEMPLIAPFSDGGFLDQAFDAVAPPFNLTTFQPSYNPPGDPSEPPYYSFPLSSNPGEGPAL
ncbi:hypothetical protein OQA88_8114 [Cercophora sp. LCS_1]